MHLVIFLNVLHVKEASTSTSLFSEKYFKYKYECITLVFQGAKLKYECISGFFSKCSM